MKLLFSEAPSDYANYLFPYVVWGFLEPGERPAEAFARGFLPSLPDLSRFYLCRQVRVRLDRFQPSSENRRILRKGEGLDLAIVPRAQFEWTLERREFCETYARARWTSPPSPGRIDRLFHAPMTTHVGVFLDRDGVDRGLVTLYQDEGTWFYSNAFYEPDAPAGRGAFLMTSMVDCLARDGQGFLHLGTCYSRSALYKTQFAGVEFHTGNGWSADLEDLKFRIAREDSSPSAHLLEDPAYAERWLLGGADKLSGWTVSAPSNP
jgi:hypothetical protein